MNKDELKIEKWSNVVRWLLIAIYGIAIVALADWHNVSSTMILIVGAIFMLFHAPKRYGWKSTLVFMALAFGVSTIFEDISIHTGFPFGNYHYSSVVANIDQVPFPVGIIYIAVSYLSWSLGTLILNHADRHLDKKINVFALPAVSTFIMCQFDLVIDPITATYTNAWIWEDGGGFNGVPLVNFLGWYLTCYIFMQIFTIYLAKRQSKLPNKPEIRSKQYWLQPVLLYIFICCGYIVQYIANVSDRTKIVDLAGNTWIVGNLFETSVTVMIFTMLFSAVLALVNLFKGKTIDIN
ncbi:MAG: carotenoid biosynthesis protein [Clostridiales bacterium]|jgi:putative membrane protein|nr:carotenoid biosynthesis protein [Clostridiales bacterium]